MRRYHVYPENDLIEHNTDGEECMCNPDYYIEDDFVIVIHAAMDRRECFE